MEAKCAGQEDAESRYTAVVGLSPVGRIRIAAGEQGGAAGAPWGAKIPVASRSAVVMW